MDIAEPAWNTKDYNWDSQRMVATHAKDEEENSVGEKTSGASGQDRGEAGDGLSSPGAKSSPSAAPVILDTLKNTGGLKKKVPLTCQVEGCNRDLSKGKEYYQRYRICEDHLKMSCLMKDGVPQRFCQQCGRFHLLSEFDGDKRSCRARLALHNNRRRKRVAQEPVKSLKFDDLHRSPTKGRRTIRVGKDGDLHEDEDSDHVLAHEHGVGGEHSLRHHEDMPPEFNRHIHKVLESLRAIPPSLGGQEEARGYGGMRMGGPDHLASQDTEATLHSLLAGDLPMGGNGSNRTLTDLARRISGQSPHSNQNRPGFQDSSMRGYGQGHNEPEPLDRMNALEMFTSGRISLDDAKRLLQQLPQDRPNVGGFPEGGSAYGSQGFNPSGGAGTAAEHKDTFASLTAGLGGSGYNSQNNYGNQNVLSAAMDFGRSGGTPQREYGDRFASGNRESEGAAFNQFGSGSGSGSPGFNMPGQAGFGQSRSTEVLDSLRGHANSASFGAASAGYSAPGDSGAGNQNLTEVNEQLMRISLKLAECTPERLPPELRNEIVNILRVQPSLMEGYVRPGCVHLVLDVISAAASQASAEDCQDVLERFQDALQKWKIPNAIVQMPGGAIQVKNGALAARWIGGELEEAAPSQRCVRTCALLSAQNNTVEVAECGGSADCEVVARFQGRFLQVEVDRASKPGSSLVSLGPVYVEGVMFIEKYDGRLAGNSEAILMVQNSKVLNELQQLCKFRGLHRDLSDGLNQLLSNIGNVLQFLPILNMLVSDLPSAGSTGYRLSPDHPFCEEHYLDYITTTAQQVLAVCCCMGWRNLATKVLPVAAVGAVSFADLVVSVWQQTSQANQRLQAVSKDASKCVLDGRVLDDGALPWLMVLSGQDSVDLGHLVTAREVDLEQVGSFLMPHSGAVQHVLTQMGVSSSTQPAISDFAEGLVAPRKVSGVADAAPVGQQLQSKAAKLWWAAGSSDQASAFLFLALSALLVCLMDMWRGDGAGWGLPGAVGVLVLLGTMVLLQRHNFPAFDGAFGVLGSRLQFLCVGSPCSHDSSSEQNFKMFAAANRASVDVVQSAICVFGHFMLCYSLAASQRGLSEPVCMLVAQMVCSGLPGLCAVLCRRMYLKHRELVIVISRASYHLAKVAFGFGAVHNVRRQVPFANSVLFALLLVQRPLLFQTCLSMQIGLVTFEAVMDLRMLVDNIPGMAVLSRGVLMVLVLMVTPTLVASESERALRRAFVQESARCPTPSCSSNFKSKNAPVDRAAGSFS